MANYKLKFTPNTKTGSTKVIVNASKLDLLSNSIKRNSIVEKPNIVPPPSNNETWAAGEFKALITKYPNWVGYYNTMDIREYAFNPNSTTYQSKAHGNNGYEGTWRSLTLRDWGDNQQFVSMYDSFLAKVTMDLGDGPQTLFSMVYRDSLSGTPKDTLFTLFIPKDTAWLQKYNGTYLPNTVKFKITINDFVVCSMFKVDSSNKIGRTYLTQQSEYKGTPVFEKGTLSINLPSPSYNTPSGDKMYSWTYGRQGPGTGKGNIKITMIDGSVYNMPIYG